MNTTLRNKVAAAIASGASAVAIAVVMLSGMYGLENTIYIPYKDSVGVITVCTGHTGPDIIWGKRYTQAECDALLKKDMAWATKAVDSSVKVPIPNSMRAALYTFTINVGATGFRKSQVLARVNAGDRVGACNALMNWTRAGNNPTALKSRREVEKEVCRWQITTKN
ncbi:MAG: hypothetical protein [Caudoviricetes sp.]|nr:MAG: hypothetical protein [Caudoviricetes sp.]